MLLCMNVPELLLMWRKENSETVGLCPAGYIIIIFLTPLSTLNQSNY